MIIRRGIYRKLTDGEPTSNQREHISNNLKVEGLDNLSDDGVAVLSVESIDLSPC